MSDVIVEKAIKALSERINLSTGLSNPMDKDAAIDLLTLLKKEGINFTAEEIKILAIRNGWKSNEANKLYAISENILAGRKPRKHSQIFTWNKDLINLLKTKY